MNSALRRESQGSLNSSASLDLGFLAFVSSKSEVSGIWGGNTVPFWLGSLPVPFMGSQHSQQMSALPFLAYHKTNTPSFFFFQCLI